jgi:hypothetical protein
LNRFVVSVVFILMAMLCGWRALRSWRLYRCGSKRPILWDVRPSRVHRGEFVSQAFTAEQIRNIPSYWPLQEARWPPPRPSKGAPISAEVARAYSRLAAQAVHRHQIASEGLVIVGGAWLGITLATIWEDFVSAPQREQSTGAIYGWAQFGHILPAYIILLGLAIRTRVEEFDEARRAYVQASEPDLPEGPSTLPHQGRLAGRLFRQWRL